MAVRPRRAGFTLISVLVAITLLSIGIMALARMQFTITRVTREESSRTMALQLATTYLEMVRTRDPWTVSSEAATAIDSTGVVAAGGTFTRQLTVVNLGTQLLRVTVAVTPRQARPVYLQTMIFRVSR
jgi:type IV pilus modification protein PilV